MLTLSFFFSGNLNFLIDNNDVSFLSNIQLYNTQNITFSATSFLNLCENLLFGFKVVIILIFFCYIRATYARYRFDQLMKLNWKNLLLISLGLDLYLSSFIFFSKIIL